MALRTAILFAPHASNGLAVMPIANRPLITHALDWLREGGIRRIAVVPAPEVASAVRELVGATTPGEEIACIEPQSGATFGSALGTLKEFIGRRPFVVHTGDSLYRQTLSSILGAVRPRERDAVVLVREEPDSRGNQVVPLRRVKDQERGAVCSSVTPAGLYIFGTSVLEAAHRTGAGGSMERGIDAAIGLLRRTGGRVDVGRVAECWRYGEDAGSILAANRFALEGLRPIFTASNLVDSHVHGVAVIDRSAMLRTCLVRGPAIIGPETRVTDACVGPYTSIGPRAVVEGAEIENSILLAEARVSHLGARLEDSIVGPKATVTRDFRLPRGLRLKIGEGAEVILA